MINRMLLIVGLLLVGSFPAAAQDTQTRTIFVGPTLANCTNVVPQKCLQVKESADGKYQSSSIPVEGFTFEPGYEYQLQVEVTTLPTPPADALAEMWTLKQVVSTTRSLEGNLWQLASYQSANRKTVDALPNIPVTLEFRDGDFGGSGGCNSYHGSYMLDGTRLQLSHAVSTLMACAAQGVMDQETRYFTLQSQVTSYQIADDQLHLLDAEGVVLMTFDVIQPAPLVSTTWVMTSYSGSNQALISALPGVDVTAVFGADGQLAGSAGCNSYGASYNASMGMIGIEPAISTKMACTQPDGIMTQEQAYLNALQNVVFYTIHGDVLELQDLHGKALISYQARAGSTS